MTELLNTALARSAELNLSYAGCVYPDEAWALLQAEGAVLVDVRSSEERVFVGEVPGSLHVPWATGTSLQRNPRFNRELEAKLSKETNKDGVVLFLCRSGNRSHLAAQVAAGLGYTHVFNIAEGFEGDLNEAQQRGHTNGWRQRGLPWVQH